MKVIPLNWVLLLLLPTLILVVSFKRDSHMFNHYLDLDSWYMSVLPLQQIYEAINVWRVHFSARMLYFDKMFTRNKNKKRKRNHHIWISVVFQEKVNYSFRREASKENPWRRLYYIHMALAAELSVILMKCFIQIFLVRVRPWWEELKMSLK